jgi:hypothetical protein
MKAHALLFLALLTAAVAPDAVFCEDSPRAAAPSAQSSLLKNPVPMPFHVFNNSVFPPVKNFAPSGYMGDIPDLRLTGSYKVTLQGEYPALKIDYKAEGPCGWAGLMWQNPPNNWGELDGGYNLTGAKKLSFWARGEKGGEVVEFKLGGTLSSHPDSDNISSGEITLTQDWTEYTIDLSEADLAYVSAGFGFVVKQESSPEGCVFYLDSIAYDK